MLPFEQRKEYLKHKTFKKVFYPNGKYSLICSTEIVANPRKLTETWTVKTSKNIETYYSKDAENLLVEQFAAKVINPDYVTKINILP